MVDGVVWMPEAAQWMECDRADGLRTGSSWAATGGTGPTG